MDVEANMTPWFLESSLLTASIVHRGLARDHRQGSGLTDLFLFFRDLGPDVASEKVIALGLVECNYSEMCRST